MVSVSVYLKIFKKILTNGCQNPFSYPFTYRRCFFKPPSPCIKTFLSICARLQTFKKILKKGVLKRLHLTLYKWRGKFYERICMHTKQNFWVKTIALRILCTVLFVQMQKFYDWWVFPQLQQNFNWYEHLTKHSNSHSKIIERERNNWCQKQFQQSLSTLKQLQVDTYPLSLSDGVVFWEKHKQD